MSIPFYHVVRPEEGAPFLATRSGLKFRTAEQGAILLATRAHARMKGPK